MKLRGHEARVVFEVDLRRGGTVRIPLPEAGIDIDKFDGLGVLRIPVRRSLLDGWHYMIREAERDFPDA